MSCPLCQYSCLKDLRPLIKYILNDRHAHTRTDGTDFIPLTADTGGKNGAEIVPEVEVSYGPYNGSRGGAVLVPFFSQCSLVFVVQGDGKFQIGAHETT